MRTIIHLDLDTFFVSVERLKNSELVGKPIIIGGLSDRGVVASCSYETRKFGVSSAMPMRTARLLCPDAIIIQGDHESYSKYSHIVTEIIEEKSPVVEKASIDEHYIDISGMDTFYNSMTFAHELRETVMKETGLPISFGLSVNKCVSKIATGIAKPCGEKQVTFPEVRPFLNPLSIRKIPMLGDKSYHLLRSMGISTIETLSKMPPTMMEHVLGKNGIMIWQRANGIDESPVIPYSERRSIGTEETFEKDTTDLVFLERTLITMLHQLAYELRKEHKLTSCVTVKVKYSDFQTHTKQCRIPYTANDHTLLQTVKDLFKKTYDRRLLVRLVGIRFSHLVHGSQQIDLFENTQELSGLYLAMDKIRKRFGDAAVLRAITI